MKNLTVNAPFYSQRADPALAVDVARITGKTDCFATDFMARIEEDKNPSCTRLVAARNANTNRWEIKRQTHLEGMTRQQTETRTSLCFFDALHYLARFQTTEADLGKQRCDVNAEGFSGIQHYTETAKQAGQAIDADGEIHPCINGRILTDGFFDDTAMKIAATTKGRNLAPVKVGQTSSFIDTLNDGLMQATENASAAPDLIVQFNVRRERAISRDELIGKFEKVIERTNTFVEMFKYVVRIDFEVDHPLSDIKNGILTLGIRPAILYAMGSPKHAPVRSIYKTLNDMNNSIAALPDGQEKSLMQEFSKAAAYAIPMEQAAIIYRKYWIDKPSRVQGKGLSLINDAATVLGLGATDTACLKADYLAGKITTRSFQYKMERAWDLEFKDGLNRKLHAHIQHIRQQP